VQGGGGGGVIFSCIYSKCTRALTFESSWQYQTLQRSSSAAQTLDRPKRKTNKMRQSPGMGGGGGEDGGELEEADGGGGGSGAPVDAQKGVLEELANKSAYMRQVEHVHARTHMCRWRKTHARTHMYRDTCTHTHV